MTFRGRFISHREEFIARVMLKTNDARQDVAEIGRQMGGPSDTRAEGDRVGSSRVYAKKLNRGAYIRPTRKRALRFADGGFRMVARPRANRWLDRSVKFWGERLASRLREVR